MFPARCGGPTRLDLVKSSLKLLVNNLRDKDKVAIVVYAGNASVKLESTPGSDKQKIRDAIDELTSGGSTAGGAGIQLAYKVAKQNFLPKGNNRIILVPTAISMWVFLLWKAWSN